MVEEYQKIMKETYGEEISFDEAKEQGENLVRFYQLLIDIDMRNKNK